jgi:hypothetical protein
MPNYDADRYRKQAEEARQQAEKAISPLDKEAWLQLAEEWLKLALSAEGRQTGVRPPQLPSFIFPSPHASRLPMVGIASLKIQQIRIGPAERRPGRQVARRSHRRPV